MAYTLEDFKNRYGYEGQLQLAPVQKTHDYYEAFGDPNDPTHETQMLDFESAPQWRTNQQVEESYNWQKQAAENEQIMSEAPSIMDNMTPTELINYLNKPIIGSSSPQFYTNNNNPQTLDQKLGYLANQANAAIADTYGGIAGFLHADDTAKYFRDYSDARRDNNPIELNDDYSNMGDYISTKGLGHDFANLGGSMAALAPLGFAGAEFGAGSRALTALAERSPALARALSLGEAGLSKLPKNWQEGLKWGANYATTKAVPESMSEGGQVRLDLLENNPNHIDPTMASIETALLNYPLLVASDMIEGATLGRGAFNIPKKFITGLLGDSTAAKVATAPVRALPNMAFNGLSESTQEALQEAISAGAKGEDYGVLPWNWTDEQGKAFRSTLLPAALLGLAGGSAHATRDNNKKDTNNKVNNSGDILTSDAYRQQQAQLNNALLQNMQQNNVPMGNTPSGNVPQGTPVTNDAVESAVAPFLGVRMDNGANGCVEAVTKIGAKMGSPFLTEQLRNGVVYVPTLVKNAGDKVIPFDASKLEAGDLIVYGDDDHVVMYDGKGGYVGNSSSQQKVVHGSDYNSMDDLEPTKIIKTDTIGGGAPASTGGVDISNRPGGHVAQFISEQTGIPADWIWAQMAHETGNFSSDLAREDHNYGGIKETREGHQGVGELGYRHFDSDEEYADYAAKNLNAYTENGIKDARTIEEFAKALKDGGYYEDSLENYTNSLKNALGGDSSVKGGNMSAANAVGQMDDTAAVSLMDDFIGEVVTGGQLSQEAIAALTDSNGHFVNNAENRAALLDDNEELFREYLSSIANASDAELAKRVAGELSRAGDITTLEQVQQAIANGDKERLEVIANGARQTANRLLDAIRSKKGQDSSIKISNSEIITKIINNAGSKNKNIKGFYNDFIQDRISSIDNTNEINELSSMLNVNGKFQNTPENRQALAQKYKQEIADYYNNVYGPRHKASAQQEPVQQAPVQPVQQQPQQAQVPTVQNNAPMAQQAQEQNAQPLNYQAMGTRMLEMMKERSIPHNADNLHLALNSGNNELIGRALRHMYSELANSGIDTNELNNELIKANTPMLKNNTHLLEEGGISDATNKSENSNAETTTTTEGINSENQVQDSEPEQAEKTGEVKNIPAPSIKRTGKYKCFSFDYKNGVFTFWSNKAPKADTAITYTWEELQRAKSPIGIGLTIEKRFEDNFIANNKDGHLSNALTFNGKIVYFSELSNPATDFVLGVAKEAKNEKTTESQQEAQSEAKAEEPKETPAEENKEGLDDFAENGEPTDEYLDKLIDKVTDTPVYTYEEDGNAYVSAPDNYNGFLENKTEKEQAHIKRELNKQADKLFPIPLKKYIEYVVGKSGDKPVKRNGKYYLWGSYLNNVAYQYSRYLHGIGYKGKTEPEKAQDKSAQNEVTTNIKDTSNVKETKQGAEPEAKTEFQKIDDDYYGFFSETPKYKSLGIAKRAKEHLEKYRGQVDTPTGGFADNYKDMVEKAAKSRYKAELDNDDSILKYTRPWSQKSKYYIGSMEVSKTVYDYYNYLLDNHMVENEVDDGHYGFINKQAHNRLHTHGDIAEDLRSRQPNGSTAKERVESLAESYIRDLASGKKESVDKFLFNKNLQNIEKPYFEYLINNEDFKSKVEAESKEEKPADSKRDFIRDHVIVGTVPGEKASEKKTETESVFGDKAENDAAMLEALGINPDELSDDKILTAPEGIVNTAEERARLEKELMAELNKLSANPAFNPKIYSLGLQIGMTYVKDGINTAKKLVTKLKATFGDKIGPWAPAIAETISTWPKGVPFNEKAVMAISKAVGSRFEEGLTTLDEIQDSMKEVFKNRHKEFAPMIEASYNGIKKYFDIKEAENNEQRGESESTDAGHEGLESRGSKENELEGTGGVSGQHGREGERHGSDNGQEHSNGSAASGVRAGVELETPASNGTDKRGNKSDVQMTEAEKHPSPTETPGHDYVIKDNAVDVNKKSEAVRFKQNIDAIKMLKQLETDDRMPTPSEQEVLAGYNGWGGLKGAFVPVNDKNREMNKELHEVLTDEEYEAAKSTINDAFYTSPKIIRAMWEGISRMGFKGGRILEPSMGIGNFFGAMPKDVRKKSSLHGIELDDLTSRFAKMLYPNAQIEHTGFQNAKAPDNFFDLVVSNIPFGQLTIDGYMIHNYFFANGMDKVRPGGLMMYITSQGSLAGSTDAAKMRTYLDGKADMIGAFKLPAGAFGEAGTSVSTDIVIFRKRDKNGEKSPHAQDFLNVKTQFSNYGSKLYDMNEYFVNHPENMIGTISPYGRDRFGKPALRLEMEGDIDDVAKALSEAMKTLPKNIYKPVSRNDSKVYNQKDADKKAAADENIRDFAYYLKGSEVYQNQNGEEVQITGKKNVEVLKDFIQLKHTLNALLTAERDPKATDDKIENVRKLLNKEYDSFVKKHGYLNDSKAARYFKDDPFAGFVQVLEKPIEETYTRTNKNGVVSTHKRILGVNKSDIFTKRTMQPKSEVTRVDKPDDALIASLTNKGYVDIDYMAGLMKTTPEKIIGDLKGKIFKNPASSDYETREEYLSGNVKEKLAQAEAAATEDYSYVDNVEELKKVVPEDLVSSEIDVMMGAPWIPEADVQNFVDSISRGSISVHFNRLAGTWYVNGYGSSAKYKLDGIKLPTFIEKVLNNMPIKIFDGTGDKKTLNQQKTDAANLAAEEMRRDFKDWLWTDKERENRLVKYYNDNFNTDVVRDYDGSHLTFPGMNGKIKMKPHQKNVVWRMLQGLNTLIAHCVGAGKTFEMQAAGMEMRRLGIANKPMYCLPNNVLEQFAREFRQLYPQAKILTLQSTDLPAVQKTVKMEKTEDGRRKKVDLLKGKTKAERDKILASRADRTRMLSRIRSEDWDAILISHTLFERFPLSPETTAQFIRDEINLLERTITEAKGAGNMSNTDLSNLVNAKKKLEDELEEALSASVDDIGISFEDLGIDQLFVDEADMFKNLGFHTKLGNIRGLNAKSKSNRARDMFAKTQWLTRTMGGRGVVFATGTPISNTMAEMYIMLRYLDSADLNKLGLDVFDNWIRTFGDIGQDVERKPTGDGFREVTKVKRFVNMTELKKLFRKVADIKTQDELDLDIPKLKNDKPTVVTLEPDPAIVNYIKNVVPKRVAAMGKGFKKQKGEDNMLALTNDLRKLSLNEDKIEACADRIAKKYFDTTDIKGAQLVFCDMGIPKAMSDKDKTEEEEDKETFDVENPEVYKRLIEKLIDKGIPEKEIAFIQNYNTKKKRDAIFQRVYNGDVRVLVGSTETMGAGTNCQKHLVALHDLDAPWRPRDLEQRHGRILRQGNDNDEVEIFNYVVKDSFDANMWEKLKNKAAVIAQAVNNDMSIRTLEDVELNTISYAEIEEAATGNPLIKERLNVNNALIKEKNANTAFKKKVYDAENVLDGHEKKIEEQEATIKKVEEDIANRQDTKGDNFSMTLNKKNFDKRNDAEKELNKVMADFKSRKAETIGNIGGFRLNAAFDGSKVVLQLVGKRAYNVQTNSITGIENALRTAPDNALKLRKTLLREFKDQVEQAKEIVQLKNPHEAKVKELDDRLHEIDRQIKESLTDKGEKQQPKNDVVTDPETGEIIESKASFSISVSEEDKQLAEVRKKYENTDQWMKAPNGKPTNLTGQQWLQVRTPNFKNWFGDWENAPENASKVVDENGEPMVVYHGTDNGGFDVFSIDKAGTRTGQYSAKLGAFFHEYKDYAEAFADYGRKPKSQVYEVFLNIRKPLTDVFLSTADGKKLESIKNKIEKGNHDGIIDLLGEHVVFNPNQIKSATDNSGEFSTENDNIKLSITEQADEQVDQRSTEEIKEDIISALPKSAKVEDHGDTMTIHLPNDVTLDVEVVDNVSVTDEELAQARKKHGIGKDVNITVNGKFQVTGAKRALISLARNGKKGTAYHEIVHLAYELALTKEQKQALDIAYGEQAKAVGKDIQEFVADKMRDDANSKRKLPKGLKKAYEAINDMIDKLKRAILGQDMSAYSVMRDIETGRVFEGEGTSGKVGEKYSSISENSVDKSEKADDNVGKDNPFSELVKDKDLIGRIKDDMTPAEVREVLLTKERNRISLAGSLYEKAEKLRVGKRDLEKRRQVIADFMRDLHDKRRLFDNDERTIDIILKALEGKDKRATETSCYRALQELRSRITARGTGNLGELGESIETPGEYKFRSKILKEIEKEHSKKGAFSIGKTQLSISPTQEQAPQSFLEKAFKSFAKNSNIKGDKIIVEQQDKDGEKEEVNLKNYIFSSPSRIAEKVGAFKYFYTIGKRAMDVLTQKRTDFERKLNKAFDLVKNEEDYKTLNDILISGDVEGKEWTKAELIADGVKENVAEAYTQIRRLMEKAYKMVNEARRRPQIHTINNASEKQIQDLRDNDFVDILNIKEDDKGHKKVTYKEYANWERTYTVNKATLRKYDDDPAIQVLDIKQEGDDSFTVTVRESIPPVNKLTGYIPHFFHNYMVRIMDKDGEYVDTIDSGRTEREAVQKAEAWLKENKLEDGQTIHISPKIADFTSLGMDEGQYAAVMGDKDYYRMMNNIAKQNDMTFQEAKEMLNGSVRQKNRHRFFGNLMQRKGVNGYEKNMGYILRHYFNSASRYYAMETEFKPKAINMYERLYGDFDKEAPNTTADYTRDYINDINGNPTTLEKAINNALNKSSIFRKFVASNFGERAALQMANNITSATSYLCLGYLNASSALLNLTQLINTAAYLNDFEALGKGLAKGFHHKYNLKDLRVLHESNVLNDIGLDSGSGYDVNRMGAKNLLGKINKGGMLLFKKTEAYCRCATVLAAYESARKKGKSHNEAIEYAKEINRKSNFDYGVADAPNVFRRGSILSQLLLQFKKYGIKELEVMGDMLPWNKATNGKQKAIFWGLMLLACGLLQWPGEDFLDNVFFDGKLKPKMKAWMMEAAGDSPMGKALAKAAMYGLAAPTTGIDISSRAGLADVIPSRGRDIGGPSITRTASLAADLFQGKWADALRDVSPGLYNQYAAWFAGQSTGTRGRVNNYYDSFYDKALRAMGFKSVDESIDSDIQRITSIRKKEATEEKQRAIDDYIEDPSTENYRRLVELGVKAKTVQEERKKKKMDRLERIQSGMSKNDKKGNSGLIKFAE